jgi:hypothetical protein
MKMKRIISGFRRGELKQRLHTLADVVMAD